SHMRLFIAGAKTTGHAAAQIIKLTRSSHSPCATLAIMFAVAGATSIRSACSVSAMCCGSEDSTRSNVSVRTLRPESATNVSGVTNFVASRVITTDTPAPTCTSLLTTSATLYAAIPPQTATMISRPPSALSAASVIELNLTAQAQRREENQLQ